MSADASTPGVAGGASAVAPAGAKSFGPVDRRMPDFFIVGHQKCGTTALYRMLASHPQIFMNADVKEPWFFAPELRSRSASSGRRSRPDTLEDYLELFAERAPGQLAGEASPQYIRSASAPAAIAELQPDARIIVLLREPANFLRSLHLQCVATHIETETDFGRAMALEGSRRRGKKIPRHSFSPQTLLYSDHVKYVQQLRRLYGAFAPEQVKVLIYEDFRRDNEATVREVLRFLELDDSIALETVETKPLNAVRSIRLHHFRRMIRRLGLNPAKKGRLSRAFDALAPAKLRGDQLSVKYRSIAYTRQSPPDEELMGELRRRFKGEVVALSDYLGRDLVAEWGYDRIS